MRLGSTIAVGLAVLSAANPTWARERVVTAFLGVQALGIDEREAAGLESAIEARLRASKRVEVVTRRDPGLAERCKGDARCYCRAGVKVPSAKHLLFANAGRIAPLYTFELVLVDLRTCSVSNTLFVSEMHDASSAGRRIGQLANKLVTPKESVSETAAKAERDVEQVPVIVTVVPDEQIQQLGITSLTEAFRLVPGFEVVDTNWGDLVLHHGLTSTLLFMVDGVPMTNPVAHFSTLDGDLQLAVNHLESIEFVRGPASVLWGQSAFLGIVNLITRWPVDKGERLRAHVRLGTLNTQEVFASAEGNRRWFSYFVSTTWRRSEGARSRVENSLWATDWAMGTDTPAWGNTGTTDNAADIYYDVVAKLRVAAKLQISVQYFRNFTYFEISPFGALLPSDDRGYWDKSNLLYSAAWEDTLPYGFKYRLSASRYEHKSWENFVVFPKHPVFLPYGFSSLQGNELKPLLHHLGEGRLYHTLQLGSWANRALLGLSYLHQYMPDQQITLTTGQAPGIEELDMESHSVHAISIYFQDDLSFLDGKLLLSGGLRYDHHDPYQSALSTQGAVIGGVDWLRGKLTYNEGFRPPEMNSLYSTSGVRGNPNLRPERSRALSLELASQVWGPLTIKVGGTMAWLQDLIRLLDLPNDPDFVNTPENQDSIDIYAAYGEVRLDWPRFNGFVNYAIKDLKEQTPQGLGIPLAHHTAAAGASWRIFEDFNAFATLSVVGPRTVLVGLTGHNPKEETVGPHVLLDFGFTISNLLEMFDLTVKARNPARYVTRSPYVYDGEPTPLLERRQVAEVLFTLGWSGRAPWSREDKERPAEKPGAKAGEGTKVQEERSAPEVEEPAEPAEPKAGETDLPKPEALPPEPKIED